MADTVLRKPCRFRGRLAQSGEELYKRTVLMVPSHAQAFARCLDANARILTGSVSVVRSVRAVHARCCYVIWQPASADRLGEMDAKFRADRLARAIAEYGEYTFYPTLDMPGWYWCIHDHGENKDAGVYLVHPDRGCHWDSGCKDMRFRCRRLRALCKHAEALRIHLEEDAA